MNEATNNTATADAPDPLLEAIRLYRRGLAEFNFRTFDTDDDKWDELADETYSPHLKVLSDWEEAATTAKAAKEALRITLVDDGGIMGCDDAVKAMIKAAYGYLKEVA